MVTLTNTVSDQNTLQKSIEQNYNNAPILVFIDAGVEDPQFLANGIVPEAQAFILDQEQDGIKQITEILRDYSEVESIHLVSHGSPGSLQLGNTYLSLNTLAEYQSELQTWAAKSLVLYGCNVAAGDAGEEFVAKLHHLTGANIAASTTKTGNSALGGNWDLEIEQGQVKTKSIFEAEITDTYTGIFGTVDEVEPNDSIETAQNLDSNDFTLESDPNIQTLDGTNISTSFPHISVNATSSSGTSDYYKITAESGDRFVFDIDGNGSESLDLHLTLLDSNGGSITDGSHTEEIGDPNPSDAPAFIDYTFTQAGTYFLNMYAYTSSNYVLNVSKQTVVKAANDIEGSDEDTPLSVVAPGVLDNDIDINGNSLTVIPVDTSSPNGATIVINTDGSYTYDPTSSPTLQALALGETINDTFTYTAENSNGNQGTAEVTVTVTGVNDAPVNNIPETLEINEDDALTFTGESAISISDPDGDLRSTTLSLNDGILSVDNIESLTIDGNDSETLELTGSQVDINAALATLEYTPNEDFNGNDPLSIFSNDAAGGFDVDVKLINVVSVNDKPTLEIPFAEQLEEGDNVATEDAQFSLTLDEGTFADLRDPEDTLTYTAMVEGGEAGVFEPLPEEGWLEFDAETLTFSGTPENDDVGEYKIKVVATDGGESIAEGEELTADDTFTLTVENTNDAPTVTNTFYDQLQSEETGVDGAIFTGSDASLNPDETTSYTHNFNLREEREFSITLPEDAFNDVDVDDQLTYSATLSNGDPLPEGFSFDPDTLTLSGTPDDDAVREGSYEVLVTATDLAGESVSESIVLDIENFNDAPILDLNGLDEPSKNFVALGVTPSSNLTSVVDRDLSLTDVDNDTLNAATVQISNPSNGFSESLTADTQGTNIQRTYDSNRGILYLIGEDSVENYQDVLRTVQYDNSFDSGINRELILEFGVWDFPEFDYPNFDYPYFGFAENPFNEDFYDFNPDINNIDLGDETGEFPFPEYQVASAISYTQFETDTTIGFEGGEGDYLVIADTDGGDTDDEFAISLDADNNTLVVNTNSDFSISDGYSSYLEEQLSNEQFSENIKGIGLGEGYYGYWSKPPIQAINGQTEVDFDAIYYGVDIDSMDGEDSISVDVSDLDLMESYMGSNLYLDIEDESFSGKFSEEMVETEEVMPTKELELKGTLDSGESFDRLNHEFYMDYGVSIDAEHDNPDMEDDYYSSHDSVNISYAPGSMKTVVDELDVNERVYEFEGYEGVVVTIDDNEVEDDGKSMISSDLSSENIIFSNPNDALHVETYEGDDLVNVDGIDDDFIADFVINTYDGNDTINGGASDEIIIGGAGKDILTGGVGSDTFVLSELSESLAVPGFAFDVITDLEIGSDAIVAPVAISAENITDFGVLSEFSPSAATAFLAELDADSAAILEFASRDFLVINDGIAEFDVFADAVIEISGYTGNLDDLAIGSVNDLAMDDSNNLPI